MLSDKTGTLTENQMTVREIWADGEVFQVTGQGYDPKGGFKQGEQPVQAASKVALMQILQAGLLCNDSALVEEAGHRKVQGDPTEAALIVAAEKAA